MRIIYILIAAVSLCGCFKDTDYQTKLILRPTVQYLSGDSFYYYSDCVAYAFDADTALWEILSWEDARDGILVSKLDNSVVLPPISVSTGYEESGLESGTMLSMDINQEEVLIVVANQETEQYGYMIYTLGLNLPKTYLYVRFRTWQDGEYTEGNWTYFSLNEVEILPEEEEELEEDLEDEEELEEEELEDEAEEEEEDVDPEVDVEEDSDADDTDADESDTEPEDESLEGEDDSDPDSQSEQIEE